MVDPELLRQGLTGAGLKNVTVETGTEKLVFRSGQEIWDWVLNENPIPGMLIAPSRGGTAGPMFMAMDRRLRLYLI